MHGEEIVIGGNPEQAKIIVERLNSQRKEKEDAQSAHSQPLGEIAINGAALDPRM